MASSNTSQFKEGHSTNRPPMFDGLNYNYWKCWIVTPLGSHKAAVQGETKNVKPAMHHTVQ